MQTSVTWKIKAQIEAFIHVSVTSTQTFAGKNKNPTVVENVFFSLELEIGTYINLYSFES